MNFVPYEYIPPVDIKTEPYIPETGTLTQIWSRSGSGPTQQVSLHLTHKYTQIKLCHHPLTIYTEPFLLRTARNGSERHIITSTQQLENFSCMLTLGSEFWDLLPGGIWNMCKHCPTLFISWNCISSEPCVGKDKCVSASSLRADWELIGLIPNEVLAFESPAGITSGCWRSRWDERRTGMFLLQLQNSPTQVSISPRSRRDVPMTRTTVSLLTSD